jgi:hypothetical protein
MRATEFITNRELNENVMRNTALVVALTSLLASSPAVSEPSAAAQAIGIARTIDNFKGYGREGFEAEATQELTNILQAIQGHPNRSKLLPIIKKMIKSDEANAPTNVKDLPPMTNPEDARQ